MSQVNSASPEDLSRQEAYVNELHPELLGLHALNPFAKHNSSARSVMFANHFAQRLVIDGADEQRIQSGVAKEFGKYTFSIKMPVNARVIKIIDRYPRGIDISSLNYNPETIVIFENDETKEIDYISIPRHASYHQFFGFKYELKNEALSMLKPGAYIPKDTIFADSPGVSENSGYKFGKNLNVAFMSIPSVSEDGMMICEDVLPSLKFRVYETRVVEFGASQFPLNLYGSVDNYKPFPDIGDYIREDGVLMMLREYDNDLMPVEMSAFDTMEVDFVFDRGVYVRGGQSQYATNNDTVKQLGQGRIVDIRVISSNTVNKQLPDKMCAYIEKYERALVKFHQEILQLEAQLRAERKKKFGEAKLKLSPKLHRLMVESLAIVNHNSAKLRQNLSLLYRKAPIDEFRIEFVVEYEIIPNIGYKLTGQSGDKGVIVKIEKRENMPVDEAGNSADLVVDSASTIARMNLGRLYEHYYSAALRDMSKNVCNILGIHKNATPEKLMALNPEVFEKAYSYMLGFYRITSDQQFEMFANRVSQEERYEHIANIVNDGDYLFVPINSQKDSIQVIKELEQFYRPTYGPVSYVGNSGQRVMTKNKIRIAPMYMMLLDKIADDWSSVSSGKLQHFGVLSPMTKHEKFLYPFRNSPVRTIGETEGRIFAGYCGREAIAEMMDRSNSPMTQRNIVHNILTAEQPGNIENVVDRKYIPLGSARPLLLVRHILMCAGMKSVYEPED